MNSRMRSDLFQELRKNKIVNYWNVYFFSDEVNNSKSQYRFFILKETEKWFSLIKVYANKDDLKITSSETPTYWIDKKKILWIDWELKEWIEWMLTKYNKDFSNKSFIEYVNKVYEFLNIKEEKLNEDWLVLWWDQLTIDDIEEEKDEFDVFNNDEIKWIIRREIDDFNINWDSFVKKLELLVMKDYMNSYEWSLISNIEKMKYKLWFSNEQIKETILKYVNK